MDQVLGVGDVDLVSIVIDALENLEGAVSSRVKLGLPCIRKAIFAKM
jgi:hypothetical protein